MSNEDEREDMLAILRNHRPIYFAVFISQTIAWCIAVSVWEFTSGENEDTLGKIIAIGLKMAPLTGLSVITTIILVDIGRFLVILLPTPSVRRKIREEAKAEGIAEGIATGIAAGITEGIAEGIAEERRNWLAWNARRKEAEARGLPFNEPPPAENEPSN